MTFEPVVVKADDDGARLDRWIKKYYPAIAFGQAQKALRKGEIRINGKRAKGEARLSTNDSLRLPPYFFTGQPQSKATTVSRVSDKDTDYIRSMVIYEDTDIVVINKPAGLATQGGTGIKNHVDRLLDGLKKRPDDARPKLVHRLDKETSGVLVLGKTAASTRYLMDMFKTRDIDKIYLAVTMPVPRQDEGEIRGGLVKLGNSAGFEKVVLDDDTGKSARTLFKVLDKAAKSAALVAFKPLTGRTHQIRVHAAEALETPIIGDFKYGFERETLQDTPLAKTLHLHALRLIIPKPGNKGSWILEAPVSKHIQETIEFFGFEYNRDELEGL